MTQSQSCVLALTEEDRAPVGLVDLDDPCVIIKFVSNSRTPGLDMEATTVSAEQVKEWLEEVPNLFRTLFGSDLCLRLDGSGRTATEYGQLLVDPARLSLIAPLFERMAAWRNVLIQMLVRLPTLKALTTEIEATIRARIMLAREHEPTALDGAHWAMHFFCLHHWPQLTGPEVMASHAREVVEQDPSYAQMCQYYGNRVFAVPRAMDGTCLDTESDEWSLRNCTLMVCVNALLVTLVPRLYSELVPEWRPNEVLTPDFNLQATTIVSGEVIEA